MVQNANPKKNLQLVLSAKNQSAGWIWNFESGTFSFTDSLMIILDADEKGSSQKSGNIIQLLQPYLENAQLEDLKEKIKK